MCERVCVCVYRERKERRRVCVCVCIYIYIYIMIINKYILDIYIFYPWKIFCHLRFHEVFCKITIIRQLRRWNELKIENMTKYRQKRISFVCG